MQISIRLFLWNICLLIVFVQAKLCGQTIQEHYQLGLKAHESKDHKAFLQHFLALDSLLSNHPAVLYNLAAAYSLNQNETQSVQTLQYLLRIDANEKIKTDKDFAPIRSSNGFQDILIQIDSLQQPVIHSDTAMVIPEKTLHPESIAYDPQTGDFYLSSFHLRKIIRVDAKGKVSDFVAQAEDGLWAVSGIKIDSNRRILWATSVAAKEMVDFEEQENGKTGLFKYDLDNGLLLDKYTLEEEKPHWFGDLALHPNGDIYLTDSKQPFIYRLKMDSDSLEKYLNHPNFVSLQGITFNIPTSNLFVADYKHGIFNISLNTRKVQQIMPSKDTSLKGIDGLYFYNNSLISIQNGIKPMRVMRHYFKDTNQLIFSHFNLLDHNHPAFDEPTLGVLVGNHFFYIANSPWAKYEKNGTMFSADKLSNIIILKNILN